MCTPIPENKLDSQQKRLFNKQFCRARVLAEDTIGIIKERWPALGTNLSFGNNMKQCARYIQGLVALHNFIIKKERDADVYR